METNLAQTIDITAQRAKYDTYVKEVLADKQILARILKYTLDEFKDTDLDTIVGNIGQPSVSSIQIEPGHTNTEKVVKESEEDNVPSEGKITFDIRFSAYAGEELIKILINIEAHTMIDMARKEILPAVSRYVGQLFEILNGKMAASEKISVKISHNMEEETAVSLSGLCDKFRKSLVAQT